MGERRRNSDENKPVMGETGMGTGGKEVKRGDVRASRGEIR